MQLLVFVAGLVQIVKSCKKKLQSVLSRQQELTIARQLGFTTEEHQRTHEFCLVNIPGNDIIISRNSNTVSICTEATTIT